jgi:hypothetical protein
MTATAAPTTARRLITGNNPDAPAGPPTEEAFVPPAWLHADPRRSPDDDDAPHDDYLAAPDVQHVAEVLIAKHHRFKHLRDVRIDYRWKRRGGSAAGKATLGKCVKVSGLVRHYTDATWIIWLAADHALALDAYQLEALIFHELLHAETDEEGEKPIVRPHDFEGFACEIEEYGLWSQAAQQIAPAFRQARLPLFEGAR